MKLLTTLFLGSLLTTGLTTATFLPHLSTLPLETQAGIHVIYSWSGLSPPDRLFDLTRAGKVGGITLFKANIGPNTTTIIDLLQSAYLASPHAIKDAPLLIMTDQEGGNVRRVAGGPELTARQMGDSENPVLSAIEAGIETHKGFVPYHVNANLTPVLDIFREEGNFFDSKGRSFGNTSARVVECAIPYATTSQQLGVISTAKHFPGLGAAVAGDNTDLTPVTINLSLKTLRSVDMAPYISAIATGVKMIMTSWAIYPALGKLPAGLSSKWVQGELRGRLGYKGVTITDAIEAGSLTPFGSQTEVAVMAAKAGMDILLSSGQNATQGEAVTEALAQAVKGGKINVGEFDKATERIVELRRGIKGSLGRK